MSPVLPGGFLTTVPPGKSPDVGLTGLPERVRAKAKDWRSEASGGMVTLSGGPVQQQEAPGSGVAGRV